MLLASIGLTSCSSVQDQQVLPATTPEEVIRRVGERLPDASGVVFRPVIAGKIWLANAYASSTTHNIFVSRTQILVHLRNIGYLNSAPIRQIVGESTFGTGEITIARISEIVNAGETEYQADFALKGQRYLLTCKEIEAGQTRYEMTLHPRAYNQFETKNYDDLPNEVKGLVSPGDFRNAVITEEGNGAVFQLELAGGILEIDDDMNVLFSSMGSVQDMPGDQLLPSITEWLQANPVSSRLNGPVCQKFIFRETEGYRLIYSANNEKKYLFFDKFGENLYHYYSLSTVL